MCAKKTPPQLKREPVFGNEDALRASFHETDAEEETIVKVVGIGGEILVDSEKVVILRRFPIKFFGNTTTKTIIPSAYVGYIQFKDPNFMSAGFLRVAPIGFFKPIGKEMSPDDYTVFFRTAKQSREFEAVMNYIQRSMKNAKKV